MKWIKADSIVTLEGDLIPYTPDPTAYDGKYRIDFGEEIANYLNKLYYDEEKRDEVNKILDDFWKKGLELLRNENLVNIVDYNKVGSFMGVNDYTATDSEGQKYDCTSNFDLDYMLVALDIIKDEPSKEEPEKDLDKSVSQIKNYSVEDFEIIDEEEMGYGNIVLNIELVDGRKFNNIKIGWDVLVTGGPSYDIEDKKFNKSVSDEVLIELENLLDDVVEEQVQNAF